LKRELVITSDGSHTLFLPEVNEHYHSYHGAINESKHVFIKNGLDYYLSNNMISPINILEIGMGTGLNVFLTFLYTVERLGVIIDYVALEPFPISVEFVPELNYIEKLNAKHHIDTFNLIHSSEFNKKIKLYNQFTLTKKSDTLQDSPNDQAIDIIFFDAFAPRVQPELWTKEVFDKLYSFLKPGGILVTYCAKGEVKRTLKASGFKVESLPGPPGKREMVRAVKLI
jgi:tRNA U34 5-methylaminomethyl-2-thiouridine-forming methyltransferase MnmC